MEFPKLNHTFNTGMGDKKETLFLIVLGTFFQSIYVVVKTPELVGTEVLRKSTLTAYFQCREDSYLFI